MWHASTLALAGTFEAIPNDYAEAITQAKTENEYLTVKEICDTLIADGEPLPCSKCLKEFSITFSRLDKIAQKALVMARPDDFRQKASYDPE
jgi:hypothetical protein